MIDGQLCRDLQRVLRQAGQEGPIDGCCDERTRQALSRLIGMENLTKRFREVEGLIDRQVAAFLGQRWGGTE